MGVERDSGGLTTPVRSVDPSEGVPVVSGSVDGFCPFVDKGYREEGGSGGGTSTRRGGDRR